MMCASHCVAAVANFRGVFWKQASVTPPGVFLHSRYEYPPPSAIRRHATTSAVMVGTNSQGRRCLTADAPQGAREAPERWARGAGGLGGG